VYDLSQHATVPGYEVIDLGTLGGEFTWPFALNNRGEVVGTSATAGGKSRPFLWRDGAITDINPPGEDLQEARTINDVGAIAGSGGQGRLPTWSDGVFTGFVSVPSSEYGAWPVRILESRDVIVNVEKHEFPTPLFVRNGTVVNLGSLSTAPHGWALDINSRDQIVGRSAYQYIGLADYEFRAFLWEDGTMRELGNLGTAPCEYVPEQRCGPSAARDINEAGDVVGVAFNGATSRAVLWSAADRTPHDLGFGSGASEAVAINERGQIAGDDGDDGFFRDADGAVRSIGSLGGGKTQVAGMSEDGVIAGTSRTASGDIHAFVWRPDGGMDDLGAGPFGGSHVATTAIAVNDRGDILGTAQPCETSGSCPGWGQTRGVLWRRIASPLVSRRP
jgi:probable HAF family extracellular repeat protein